MIDHVEGYFIEILLSFVEEMDNIEYNNKSYCHWELTSYEKNCWNTIARK